MAAAFLGVILCLCIAGYALVFWVLVREPTLSEPMLELSEAPLCSSAADVRAALHAYVPEGTPYRDAVDSLVRIGFSIDGSSDESHVMFKRANECLVPPKGTAHQPTRIRRLAHFDPAPRGYVGARTGRLVSGGKRGSDGEEAAGPGPAAGATARRP